MKYPGSILPFILRSSCLSEPELDAFMDAGDGSNAGGWGHNGQGLLAKVWAV